MQFATQQAKLELFHLLRAYRWRLTESGGPPRRRMVPFPERLDDLPLVCERVAR